MSNGFGESKHQLRRGLESPTKISVLYPTTCWDAGGGGPKPGCLNTGYGKCQSSCYFFWDI